MAKFCPNCGSQANDNAFFCMRCGCAIHTTQPFTETQFTQYTRNNHFTQIQSIVSIISQRINTSGMIWLVIGALQILLGIFMNFNLLIVGIFNLATSIQDIKYSKTFPLYPVGIVNRVKPLTSSIISLIYNLIIGGVIGVAGSIYYFVAVRGYVLEHEQEFLAIENQHNRTT